ncbi:hypothetical protein TNCT_68121 [Trichonephila clavata]|uniref:Uncharacterized protein n=1 Tax=Trichonephila clavata TaxID=2740835 RepID=A0A8X6GRX1_TRICU|nr:hypothetical protein TNCT_68121 [Trichonephila clavata]
MPRGTIIQRGSEYSLSYVSTALLGQMSSTNHSATESLGAEINRLVCEVFGVKNCKSKKETVAVKEEKKLMKHFQKMVPLYIQKKQNHLRHLNKMEKKLVDIVKDEKKLLKVIRSLKCANRWDVGKLIKHFGMEIRFIP